MANERVRRVVAAGVSARAAAVLLGLPNDVDVACRVLRVTLLFRSRMYVPVTLGGCCPRRDMQGRRWGTHIYTSQSHIRESVAPIATDHIAVYLSLLRVYAHTHARTFSWNISRENRTVHTHACRRSSTGSLITDRSFAEAASRRIQQTKVHRYYHSRVHVCTDGRTNERQVNWRLCATYREVVHQGAISIHRRCATAGRGAAAAKKWVNTFCFVFSFPLVTRSSRSVNRKRSLRPSKRFFSFPLSRVSL